MKSYTLETNLSIKCNAYLVTQNSFSIFSNPLFSLKINKNITFKVLPTFKEPLFKYLELLLL